MRTPLRSVTPAGRCALLAALLIVLLAAGACGSKPSPTALPSARATQPAVAQATQAPATQPAPAQPTPPPTVAAKASPTVAPKTSPTAKPSAGKYADPDELNSYRMKTTTWEKGGDKAKASVILVEWVKDPPSKHTTMGSTEIITIRDQTWVKLMGNWVLQNQATPQPQGSDVSANIMRQIEDKIVYKETGWEMINGIACKHYTYSGEATVQIAEGALKGEATVRGQGESWVADQPGLPQVVIRNRGESEMKMKAPSGSGAAGDINIAMNIEMDLYDINTSITIKPPTDVFTPPAPPAGSTVRPTVTRPAGQSATPRPSATVALRPTATTVAGSVPTPDGAATTYDFKEPLDRSWYGQGGVNAEINVEARPGFLRFTAPSGNDLFPDTNFDAPTRFRVIGGDFTLETVVEFDPQEDYQGAGLFIWQDQDNFVRLERCFGGLGGGESGICFLKVANGGPEVIASSGDMPTTAGRVALRLQKANNRVAAWWRDAASGASGAWQTVGSTEIALPGGPQPLGSKGLRAGMLLCVEQGAAEISADFDYLRITSAK
ncbi:MAG: hypothetical protein NT169_03945 [Chloroflexi bacterium]|nr:hypothetical protein [Chloroflexota bacterium]